MLKLVTSKDEAYKAAKSAAAARLRLETSLTRAIRAEEAAIQDAVTAAGGIEKRGVASEVADLVSRSGEHVRKVANPSFKRGHYATPSD